MFQPERTHNERIYLSVSWQRPNGAIPRGNAEIHAEMARLVQGVGRKGPHQIPWTSARARRQGRQSEAVHDGPYAEAKDIVNGFTLIEAKDLPHAVELSKGCP